MPMIAVPGINKIDVIGIANKADGKRLPAQIKKRLEKGGTLVDIDGKPQIMEGFRFPVSYDQGALPYFSTAHQIVKTEALLRLFGMDTAAYFVPGAGWYVHFITDTAELKAVLQARRRAVIASGQYVLVPRRYRPDVMTATG